MSRHHPIGPMVTLIAGSQRRSSVSTWRPPAAVVPVVSVRLLAQGLVANDCPSVF